MEGFFTGIQWLFENIFFLPYYALSRLELQSWLAANIFSFLFIIIGFAAFFYWMRQLKMFKDNNEDRTDVSAHDFL